ncbi:MAG: hypothetical protein JW828_00315, partial [Sedimentisphaerales bacterium]|nr:hypothetical protein [Sedimentisphaerales bacterium]
HQPYADRFGRRMGTSIPGVFVDNEGDYGYKLAWSDHLDRRYREKWNSDIRLWMPLLFDQDAEGLYAKARWEWFEVVSDIYSEYLGATNRWLAERGMYCISNLWEESLMWQAGAVGDFMKTQRSYSLPGTDCLGLNALKPHDFKETQSVTEFEGRRMQSEIMGAAGFWGFNPITIKQVANAVTAWGISHVVPHGIFTTRKLEGNPWLPDWYEQNPMWPWLHLWTDFVRRASFINSHGHTVADVLLLNPMDSVWALSGPGAFDPSLEGRVPVPAVMPLQGPENVEQTPEEFKKNSAWWCPPKMDEWFSQQVRDINAAYSSAIDDLTNARIEFLIADRHYMGQMQLEGKTLVRPPFRFKAVVLPPMVVLPYETAETILRFARVGGYVYALGSLPSGSVENGMNDLAMQQRMRELEGLPTFVRCPNGIKEILARGTPGLQSHTEFYKGEFDMLQQHRQIDGQDFFWLVNNTHKSQTCTLRFPGLQGRFQKWDCETGSRTPLPSTPVVSGSLVRLDFDPYQAYWVVHDSSQPPLTETGPKPEAVVLQTLEGPWTVQIDPAIQPPLEHKPVIPEGLIAPNTQTKPLDNWQGWGLERFSGYVDYSITIHVKSAQGRFILDLGKVRHLAEVWINGQSLGKRLWPPFVFDVSEVLQTGKENQIRIRVGNLINNNYGQEAESGLFGPVQILRR